MKRSAPSKSTAAGATGVPRKPRGRPRSFDRDAALDAAMQVFWEKGFEGTSISDLTKAMGLNPPSIYSAFGDKERLFVEAVERYSEGNRESCPFCDEPTARGAIEKLLTYSAHELTESSHPRGCLMTMASTTAANSSDAMQKLIARKRAGARDSIRERIKLGLKEGDVPAGTDANALADFYFTILGGMALSAREGASRRSLIATVEQAMSLFPKVQRKAVAAAA